MAHSILWALEKFICAEIFGIQNTLGINALSALITSSQIN